MSLRTTLNDTMNRFPDNACAGTATGLPITGFMADWDIAAPLAGDAAATIAAIADASAPIVRSVRRLGLISSPPFSEGRASLAVPRPAYGNCGSPSA